MKRQCRTAPFLLFHTHYIPSDGTFMFTKTNHAAPISIYILAPGHAGHKGVRHPHFQR